MTQEKEPAEATENSNKVADHSTSGFMILAALALIMVVGMGLHAISGVFGPLFLAVTLVFAVRPFGQFLMRWHVPSWLASTATLILTIGIIAIILTVTVWTLTPVPDVVVSYSDKFQSMAFSSMQWLQDHGVKNSDVVYYASKLNVNSIVAWTWTLVGSLFTFGGILSIVGIAAFFLTVDTTLTKSRAVTVDSQHWNLGQAMRDFEKRVRYYWIVTTVFGLIVAVIDGLVLEWMAIPLAWTWAYWAFITNYVPNIGFIVGLIPPMLIGLLESGWQTAVWILVIYTIINIIIQNLIQPKFTGDVVGLSASVTFFSLVLWTSIMGMLGSVLAVPLTLFFKSLFIDSDPRTRWLDVYLVSEGEVKRRQEAGYYDNTDEQRSFLPDFSHPFTRMDRETRKHYRPKLAALSRQLKRAEKKENR